MKLLFKYLIFLFTGILVLFSSCRNNQIEEFTDSEGNLVIKEWYNETEIKSITTYFNKDKTDFLFVTWSEEDQLMDSARYINDTIEGLRKVYDADAGLMHYETYHNGHLDGMHKAVYDNGVTSFEGFWKNYVKVGEWKFHFPEGNPITYEFYDSTGRLKYFRKYDEDGTVLKVEGSGLISVQAIKSVVNPGEFVSGKIEAAVPPGCKTELSIVEILNGEDSNSLMHAELSVSVKDWKLRFVTPGRKTLKFTIKIIDQVTQKEEISSSQLDIQVFAEQE